MSILERVTSGARPMPYRLIVYGVSGIGKTTFASEIPDALLIDTEKRSDHVPLKNRLSVESWDEVLGAARELVQAPKQVYKTLVLDTVDHAELAIMTHLMQRDGVDTIDEVAGGYGKWVNAVLSEWRRFAVAMDMLRAKGYNIVMIGHGHIREFKNPLGENYNRWQMKLVEKSCEFLRERFDAVGFAHYDDGAVKIKGESKATATGGKNRRVSFVHSPAYESKVGLGLDATYPLKFEALNLK